MCGIFGFWLNRKLNHQDISLGDKLTNMLAHRGPENQNSWFQSEKGIYFGFRRLKIIDLSESSNQPMERNGNIIAFNGEIYNFRDIKVSLEQKNYIFKSKGDAEVLINSWDQYGSDSLNKLDGMFAFSLFHKNNLYLVTDFFGEKPLFYYTTNEGVFFSSEIDPLLQIHETGRIEKHYDKKKFLSLGYNIDFETGYKNIKLLKPSTFLHFKNPNTFYTNQYWQLENIPYKNKKNIFEKKDINQIKSLIIESLEKRLISDVPIGLFLSSGIDSSLIASISSKELNIDLDSYTVAFNGNLDESYLAKKIANYLNINHEVIDTKSSDYYSVENLNSLFNFPNDNLTGLSIYLMSESVRKKITVAITGLGADEAFVGYNKYKNIIRNEFYYKLPKAFIRIGKKIFKYFLFINNKKLINRFLMLHEDNLNKYISLNNKLAATFDSNNNFNFFDDNSKMNFLDQVLKFEKDITLPTSYILANDHGSMRASIETRTPFLNKKIFEFNNYFSPKAFFLNGNKYPLRTILSDYLPPELIDVKKKGFNVPFNQFNIDDKILKLNLSKITDDIFENDLSLFSSKDKNKISLRCKILNNFKSE